MRIEFLKAMGLRTYIKERTHIAASQYSHFKKRVNSKISILQDRLLSKIYNQNEKVKEISHSHSVNKAKQDHSMEFVLEGQSRLLGEELIEPLQSDPKEQSEMNSNPPRGAQTTRIIVIGGEIIEKEYLTVDGKRISINFKDL